MIPLICPECGETTRSGGRFCIHCRAKLPTGSAGRASPPKASGRRMAPVGNARPPPPPPRRKRKGTEAEDEGGEDDPLADSVAPGSGRGSESVSRHRDGLFAGRRKGVSASVAASAAAGGTDEEVEWQTPTSGGSGGAGSYGDDGGSGDYNDGGAGGNGGGGGGATAWSATAISQTGGSVNEPLPINEPLETVKFVDLYGGDGFMEPVADDTFADHGTSDGRYMEPVGGGGARRGGRRERKKKKRPMFMALGVVAAVAILILATLLLTPVGKMAGIDTGLYNDPPSASFTYAEGDVHTGQTVILDASGTTAEAGVDTYRWDLDGDGTYETTGANTTTTVSFPDDGLYTMGLEVTDRDGNSDTARRNITILNRAPDTVLERKKTEVLTATEIDFSLSAIDSDGTVKKVEWDLDGDGRYHEESVSRRVLSIVYDDDGTYEAAVRVTDDDGSVGEDFVTITVLNQPPAVEVGSEVREAYTLTSVNFSLSGDDVDGEITGCRWDFDGDGRTDAEGDEETAAYTFDEDGTYEVQVWATDDDGDATLTTMSFVILNRPPEVSLSVDTPVAKTGDTITIIPEGGDPDGRLDSIEWDLDGDGAYETIEDDLDEVTTTFADDGAYYVYLLLTDDDGAETEASINVTIDNRPPEVTPSAGPTPVLTGEEVEFGAICSDDDGTLASYQWDFDADGFFDHISERTPVATWEYDDDGVYGAILRVTDDDNDLTVAVINVTVENRPPEVEGWSDVNHVTTIDPVAFSAGASDPDGEIAEFRWDWDGDGTDDWSSDDTGNTVHVFDEAGDFVCRVTAVDDDGGEAYSTVMVSVVWNIAPIADAGDDLEGLLNDPVAFDGSGSYDPDGHSLTWHWDFNGDLEWDSVSPSSAETQYTFTQVGDYTVTLMVSDGGEETKDTLVVSVTDMRKWALCVGISDYPGGGDLNYADDDAVDWYDYLVGEGYNVRRLLNSQGTEANIEDEIDWLVQNARPQDKVIFTFSGHGLNYNDAGWGGTGSIISVYGDYMSDQEIATAFTGLQTSDVMFVFDCCRSGDYDELAQYGGLVLEGCRVNEYTYDGPPSMANGVFTYYLMEAITSASADTNNDDTVSGEEMLNYAYSRCAGGWGFHPETVDSNGGEFIV